MTLKAKPIPDFVMNQPAYSEAPRKGVHEIIIGGQNWGSGSSREHAAWAIAGYGARVVISSSFADIHRNNLLNCFVLPVVVSREFQQELFQIGKDPTAEVKVDVPEPDRHQHSPRATASSSPSTATKSTV